MIHHWPNAERYEVWQFTCAHKHQPDLPEHAFARRLWNLVEKEADPLMWYVWQKMAWLQYWGGAGEGIWKKRRGEKWQAHVVTKGAQTVNPKFWSLSKAGEVNITEFKDKFKEAVARFLAGAVEGVI